MGAGAGSSHDRVRTEPRGVPVSRNPSSPASVARISLFDLKRGEDTTGGFPLASPLEVPPVLSIPIIHRFVLFVRSASTRKPHFYASAEALRGLPAPDLTMRRHPMESRETVRALPTLQLFRLPSRQSCATRAAHAQHPGGLGGCHGRDVGKILQSYFARFATNDMQPRASA